MDWKKTLLGIAPTIATALGGPFAGAATKFLAKELCGDENATIEIIEAAVIGASPQQLVKLKELDLTFKIDMEKLDIDVFNIEADEKKNARREHKDSRMPSVLSIALTVFIMLIVYGLFYTSPPAGARDILLLLLGVVIKEWSNSMHYWYGATHKATIKK